MRAYIQWLREEEKERRLGWVKYTNSFTVEMGKQKSHLSAVKRANESSQDSALHSSAGAQQSDRRPWNYRPYTLQQLARINLANTEFKRRQEDRNEREQKKERQLIRE